MNTYVRWNAQKSLIIPATTGCARCLFLELTDCSSITFLCRTTLQLPAMFTVWTFLLKPRAARTETVLKRHLVGPIHRRVGPWIAKAMVTHSRQPSYRTQAQRDVEVCRLAFPYAHNTRFALRYSNSRLRLSVWGRCVDQRLVFAVHKVNRTLSTRFKKTNVQLEGKVVRPRTCHKGKGVMVPLHDPPASPSGKDSLVPIERKGRADSRVGIDVRKR
jgi:hypothetical protein